MFRPFIMHFFQTFPLTKYIKLNYFNLLDSPTHWVLGTSSHFSLVTGRHLCLSTVVQACLGTYWQCSLGTVTHSFLATFLGTCSQCCLGTLKHFSSVVGLHSWGRVHLLSLITDCRMPLIPLKLQYFFTPICVLINACLQKKILLETLGPWQNH